MDRGEIVQTGPGTLAGRYMRMFWHPVYRAEDLSTGRAVPLRIIGEDLTLYRGEKAAPHLLAFRCAHRGTQLSTGWVEGDDLRCFYHGWKYDPSGQCIEQPAEPEPFSQKIRIRSYPAAEYLGLIFAYLGEGEPPPLPRYPDFERDGIRDVRIFTHPCNFFNGLDHRVDYFGFDFAHRQSAAPRGVLRIPDLVPEESEWGITTSVRYPDGVVRVNQFGMPNIHHQVKRIQPDEQSGWMGGKDSIQWRIPIDDEHHIAFNVEFVPLSGEDGRAFDQGRASWLERSDGRELAAEILAGSLRSADVERRPDVVYTSVQDCLAETAVGVIADWQSEQLGRSDATVVFLRRLWERELGALAEGRRLKQWTRPDRLVATYPR